MRDLQTLLRYLNRIVTFASKVWFATTGGCCGHVDWVLFGLGGGCVGSACCVGVFLIIFVLYSIYLPSEASSSTAPSTLSLE